MNPKLRIATAGAIGNVLEWYDFGLYGLLAPVLASLFFPGQSRIYSLLEIYGGFAVGFLMRPIGAVVLGHLGDRVGRRFVLVLSVTLMGVATVAVGLLPTYATAGLVAPALLIFVRLIQGFSVGGEFVDSVTYLVEASSPQRRGLTGSLANLGSTAGMLLAAGVAAAATSVAPRILAAWAWRIPFLLGGVLACAAYYVRQHLPETKGELEARTETRTEAPLRQAVRHDFRILVACVLFTSGYGIVNYLSMVFLPTFAHEFGRISESQVLRINTAGQALALFVVPLAGWLSDRTLTRRTMLACAFLLEALLSWKAFTLAHQAGPEGLWAAQLTLAFLLAIIMGTAPAMLAEQFPPGYRVSAHAVTFNIGIGVAGGTAPMVAIALVKAIGNKMAPAAYLAFGAAVAALSVFALRERSREPLD